MPHSTPDSTGPLLDLKGFACPQCRRAKLRVRDTRRPCAGLVVRYRKCPACEHVEVTEERPRKALKKNSS